MRQSAVSASVLGGVEALSYKAVSQVLTATQRFTP